MSDDNEKIVVELPKKKLGPITMLFRTVLVDIKMNHAVWQRLMQRYLDDPRNKIPNNSADRSTARGNMNKALNDDNMTIKTLEKCLRFLPLISARFELHLEWYNGNKTRHGYNVISAPSDEVRAMKRDLHPKEQEEKEEQT